MRFDAVRSSALIRDVILCILCEGIVKTHRLLFIECDTVQAVFTKHLCPNVFTAQTRYSAVHNSNASTTTRQLQIVIN